MQRGPKEKKERALGERLNLKGERCASPKCAAVRKPYRPGMHGQGGKRRRTISDFGRQNMEKQKFKVVYGLNERNLRRLFKIAERSSEGTSMKLLELMERRLDNVVYRLGIAVSRLDARQTVGHGHILVNGKRVKSPSYQVAEGDIISIREASKTNVGFANLPEKLEKRDTPPWLTIDAGKVEGKVVALPKHEESPFEISLLVESFSK